MRPDDQGSWEDKVQIVGDDFFVTNTERLVEGDRQGVVHQ